MLTNDWKSLADLNSYTFLQLDDMWQRGEVECRFDTLRDANGIARGTIHYYRLPAR
jgi:hypothetical protein